MRPIIYNDINDKNNNFYLDIGKIRIYFSSEFNQKRFLSGYKEYIEEENNKLEARYHVKIVANYYFLFAYYKKIEKRGFRIENIETHAKVRENIIFHIEI